MNNKFNNYKINGPMFLNYYANYGREIILLGDVHDYATSCRDKKSVSITNFIKDVCGKSFEVVDVFIEKDFYDEKKEYQQPQNYLQDLQDSLVDCFDKNINCPITNARIHHIDIRHLISPIEKNMMVIFNEFEEFILDQNYLKDMSRMKKNIIKSYKNILFEHTLLPSLSIIKEKIKFNRIEYVYDKNIKNILEAYLIEYMNSVSEILIPRDIENILFISKKFAEENYILTNEDEKFIRDIYKKYLLYFATMMDVYTMIRLFKNFTKNNLASYSGCIGSCPQRIIIYAGADHIHKYSEILEILKFVKYMHIDRENPLLQCIDNNDIINLLEERFILPSYIPKFYSINNLPIDCYIIFLSCIDLLTEKIPQKYIDKSIYAIIYTHCNSYNINIKCIDCNKLKLYIKLCIKYGYKLNKCIGDKYKNETIKKYKFINENIHVDWQILFNIAYMTIKNSNIPKQYINDVIKICLISYNSYINNFALIDQLNIDWLNQMLLRHY
jgi:hypothetical protein